MFTQLKSYFFAFIVLIFINSCGQKSTEREEKDEYTPSEEIKTMNTTYKKASLVLDAKAILGEGAFWHYGENKLYWVDIEGKKLHRFDPATKEDEVFEVPHRIGTVVPDTEGNTIVALQEGIFKMSLPSGELTKMVNPEDSLSNIRFNDGKCDPSGRLWVGSMHLEQTSKAASLYRIDKDAVATKMLSDITISNGIVWSKDKTKMYYIDTPTLKVMEYDFDNATGEISNPRVAVEVPESAGFPDGMSIDSEDKLWIAHWGGNAVIRWDPVSGEMMDKVEVPAPHVTSCAFTGDDLKTMYITTARVGLSEKQLKEFPNSGGLFKVELEVSGQKSYFFGE